MAEIVNNNKLTLILTNYGLSRIQEVTGTTQNLNLTKVRLGSGDNFEYYEPSPAQEALKGDLGLEFYIYDKQLLEDELTISFHTIFPEDIGGFDIREVGLYEVNNGEEHLFAISTQQPFVKPDPKDFYFININYYLFLKFQNLANIYDQIKLDIEHAQVTELDLEEIMRTFLFAQGNLVNQIGDNSTIIGYNRASQLNQKIEDNQKSFSYITIYKNYITVNDMLSSSKNIFSYWIFDYSRRKDLSNSIVDLSPNQYYMSTSVPLNNIERVYEGFTSLFTFDAPKYFKLSSQIPLNLYNLDTNKDIPFTMMFVVEPLDANTNRTIIAKSDYARNAHTIEIVELEDRSIQVKLFSDSENYLTFRTVANSIPAGAHSVILMYDPLSEENNASMTFFINSTKYVVSAIITGDNYTHISESSGNLYAYACSPKYYIYAPLDDESNPIEPLFYTDRIGNFLVYQGTDWTIEEVEGVNKIFYNGHEASKTDDSFNTSALYGWIPTGVITFDKVVYTKDNPSDYPNGFDFVPVLYDDTYNVYSGDEFGVELNSSTNLYEIKYYQGGSVYETVHDPNPEDSKDIPSKIIFRYVYEMERGLIYTNNNENPTLLYYKDGNNYPVYTGDEWTIEDGRIYRLEQLAYYSPSDNVEIESLDLVPYIIDSNGHPINYINSKVGLISIIKERISDDDARALALNFYATLGKNPYLGGY